MNENFHKPRKQKGSCKKDERILICIFFKLNYHFLTNSVFFPPSSCEHKIEILKQLSCICKHTNQKTKPFSTIEMKCTFMHDIAFNCLSEDQIKKKWWMF